jgi:ELWxxDGT repeat protein
MNTVTRIGLLFCIMVTAFFLLSLSNTKTLGASRSGSETTFPDPYLVKNINPRTHGSGPYCVAVAQTYAICSGYDGVFYGQKWRSNGTQAGTIYLEKYSKSGSLIYTAETSSGKLYFYSTGTNGFGSQLWITDGTDAGTVLVKEIQSSEGLFELVTSGETLYFINGGDQIDTHNELWKSDGTATGTVPFFKPNGGRSHMLATHQGRLYFSHQTATEGREIWTSDGSTANTKILANINPGSESSDPDHLVSAGNYLFFTADDATYGRELWRTDGTAEGTVRVKDIYEGRNGSSINQLTAVGDHVFFFATDNDGSSLWRSDGSPAGTIKLLTDISPEGPQVAGSSLFYFYYHSWADSKIFLGRSNGTPEGTLPLLEIEQDPMTGDFPSCLYNEHKTAGDTLYFPYATMEKGCELWRSDGTAASTKLVQDILPGSDSSHAAPLAYVNNLMLLRVAMYPTDDYSIEGLDDELWVTDGTAGGAKLLLNINLTPLSSAPSYFNHADSKLFFIADDGSFGRELWHSDGTEAGTSLVADIRSGMFGSYPTMLAITANGLSFGASADGGGQDLYVSDGTAVGTAQIKSFTVPPEHNYFSESAVAEWNGYMFFNVIYSSDERREFWRTDGSSPGTLRLGEYEVVNMIAADNHLYFAARDVKPGEDYYSAPLFLGATNGTPAGTVKLSGVPESVCEFGQDQMAVIGDKLFVAWCDDAKDKELWSAAYPTDQPARVKDINPNGSSFPENLAAYDGSVYFMADDGVHGHGLWRSDGTELGTELVKGISAYNITPYSNGFFFLSDGLWVSDGTTTGTAKIAELGSVVQMVIGADRLFLAGNLSLNSENKSLIASDGTATGTEIIKANLDPRDLHVAGDKLFFSGKDFNGDRELWALSLAGLPPVAEFNAAPTRGVSPLNTTFKNNSSGGFNRCTWDFGDGTTVHSCDNQSHTYTRNGAYTVNLAVSGPGGSDNKERLAYIVVGVEPVRAEFSAVPTNGPPPLTVKFKNESSGEYDSCTWDFGDSETSDVCENTSHTYNKAGTYTVGLTVKGPSGENKMEKTDYITVYEQVKADFSASPTSGVPPIEVFFDNLSTGDYDTCKWDFGGGLGSEACNNPSVIYTEEGDYTVSLTISGLGGEDTKTEKQCVTIGYQRIFLPGVMSKK